MPFFKIYAGMGGGFGGANYEGTYECANAELAEELAYEFACEAYESYAGSHGILSWDELHSELVEEYGDEVTEDDVEYAYNEQRESWISYHVELAKGEDDRDD